MKNINKFLFTIAIIALSTYCISAQYDDYLGAGHDSGITVTTSSEDGRSRARNTINARGMDADLIEISRLMSQATFGADMEEIRRAEALGMESWIDEQLNIPITYLTPLHWEIWEDLKLQYEIAFDTWLAYYITELCQAADEDPNIDPPNFSQSEVDAIKELYLEELYGPYALHFNFAWSQSMLSSDDQLRQRVAYALSQIMVISAQSDLGENGESLSAFYDILLHHSFGNFRDLLLEVSLNPAMGVYLSHMNNPKAIPEQNIHPDENYAREIMQLFSIGLFELNIDGTRKKDLDGFDIPTYNNDDIKEMARVFTGLGPSDTDPTMPHITWDAHFGLGYYSANKTEPMIMYPEWHDTGSKSLLNGLEIPARQDGITDIEMAIDYLYNHPNVGPFIGRQLIQRLVKSNPSPAYIARVATVFNDNGFGERGDMGAVVKAILLDPEARSCEEMLHFDNGKLREPVLRDSEYIKVIPKYGEKIIYDVNFSSYSCEGIEYTGDTIVVLDNLRLWNNGFNFYDAVKQFPMMSPSVFNFYLPDHKPTGEMAENDLYGPEFKIHDTSTAINYINSVYVHTAPYYDVAWYNWYDWVGIEDVKFDFSELSAIYQDDPEKFIHHLDIVFTNGQMTDDLKNTLREFISEVPQWYTNNVPYVPVKVVLYLMMWSPDYTIAK
jgi:uncharacterized protein (DUF1800 family)